MKLDIYTVDAFVNGPSSGNSAAVVPLLQPLDEEALQQLATRLNLSETAYVAPLEAGGDGDPWRECRRFSLRWFTPTNEVALCGHATLATAHVLFRNLGNTSSQLEFETKSGVLVAVLHSPYIVLDFPANPPEPLNPSEEVQLADLLKVAAGGLQVAQVLLSRTTKKLMVRLSESCTRKQLEGLRLDTAHLHSQHDGSLVKGVILTMEGDLAGTPIQEGEHYHCFSRYFAPWNGISEDPVTGSAHTVLGPYWSKQLGITALKCRQVSARSGDIIVTIRDDGRVDLAGLATVSSVVEDCVEGSGAK